MIEQSSLGRAWVGPARPVCRGLPSLVGRGTAAAPPRGNRARCMRHYAGDRRSLQPSGLGIMPVMQVIEAQSARTWSLTITSITNMSARLPAQGMHVYFSLSHKRIPTKTISTQVPVSCVCRRGRPTQRPKSRRWQPLPPTEARWAVFVRQADLCSLPSSTCRCRGRVHLRVGQKAVSFAQDCREISTGTRRHSR